MWTLKHGIQLPLRDTCGNKKKEKVAGNATEGFATFVSGPPFCCQQGVTKKNLLDSCEAYVRRRAKLRVKHMLSTGIPWGIKMSRTMALTKVYPTVLYQ